MEWLNESRKAPEDNHVLLSFIQPSGVVATILTLMCVLKTLVNEKKSDPKPWRLILIRLSSSNKPHNYLNVI